MPDTDRGFLDQVASPAFCVRLFARLPDVVFCMKDRDRRYRAANPAFAERLGFSDPEILLGKTADDFFPEYLARTYREQDRAVLEGGREISDNLELVTNRDGGVGWYLARGECRRRRSPGGFTRLRPHCRKTRPAASLRRRLLGGRAVRSTRKACAEALAYHRCPVA